MLDDDQLRKSDALEGGDGTAGRKSADREALVDKRRARQTGGSGQKKRMRLLTSSAFLAAGCLMFFFAFGSSGALKLFGAADERSQRTSQVDLSVDRETGKTSHLDFLVPTESEEIKNPAKDNSVDRKLKALEEQLSQVARARTQGMSSAEIQRLLDRHNEDMERKFDQERKAMAEENARLRAEAAAAATQRDQAKIDASQRESEAVIVDESGDRVGLAGLGGAGELPDDLNVNERFLKSAASSAAETSVSQRLADPSRTVVQGTVISAVLESAINTELPGTIRAQVMRPVYSFDGAQILMPSGTLLIGQFNNNVHLAQKRVLISWNRAITPEGNSIALGSIGTDTLGRSGTLGNVNNRYGTKFGAGLMVSVISAVPALIAEAVKSGDSGEESGTTVNIGGSGGGGGGSDIASSIGDALGDQTSGVLEEYLSLPPVIRIPQGEEIRIFVNRDLVFL